MPDLRLLVCLTTRDNDYQIEQSRDAEAAAQKLGCRVTIIDAKNDAIEQSQLLLQAIQSRTNPKPDAIIFEPVSGTGLPQVAKAAAAAGVGWIVLNRAVDYMSELRASRNVIAFAVGSDHLEIGRIQGRQVAKLLPQGGDALLLMGPGDSGAAQERKKGLSETLPHNVRYKELKGKWTELSGFQAVSSWLRISSGQKDHVSLVISQNDAMAAGARRAFNELSTGTERDFWKKVPFIGCDGLPQNGQAWVNRGSLAATIIVPANTGTAIRTFVEAVQTGKYPDETLLTVPLPFPELEAVKPFTE